jgi:hypothetical protein
MGDVLAMATSVGLASTPASTTIIPLRTHRCSWLASYRVGVSRQDATTCRQGTSVCGSIPESLGAQAYGWFSKSSSEC